MPITALSHDLFCEQRIEFQKRIIRGGHWVTCLNCDHWKKIKGKPIEQELCGLFNAMPPVHVLVNGCKDHIEDIPF